MKYFARSGASSSASPWPLLRHELEDEHCGDEPVVGVKVVAEIVMPRHLAAEHRVLLPHTLLEKGVADAVHERSAVIPGNRVLHRVAGPEVVDDRRAALLEQERLGQQRRHEIAGDELAVPVDEEAPVGVAVPGNPDVGALRDDPFDNVLSVLLDERVGLVVREGPVNLEAQARRLAGKLRRTASARPGRPCRCPHRAPR